VGPSSSRRGDPSSSEPDDRAASRLALAIDYDVEDVDEAWHGA
jgi:hypothetical protein